MEYSTNKRKQIRVKVSIPARFGVLIPEETFSPQQFEAIVSDVSERGAMVVSELDERSRVAFLQKLRFCRLSFDNVPGFPERIVGRAVWIQPITKEGGPVNYRIGVFFEDCPPEITEQLKLYVGKIAKEQGLE